jgi:nucleoside-diphosphate-sugar epimerase
LFQKKFIKNFKYFLFISSSHVYGFHKKKILEGDKRKPFNKYGNSKKNVEDFIIKNKKKFYFKIGIARIFNFTSNKQNYGHFVPDMYSKIKNRKNLINLNINRDFIHIDDVTRSLELMIKKQIDKPINICSGKKINLISLTKKLNLMTFNRDLKFINSKKKNNQDIYGNNNLLKKLGIKKFKNLNIILKSFLHGKKANISNR